MITYLIPEKSGPKVHCGKLGEVCFEDAGVSGCRRLSEHIQHGSGLTNSSQGRQTSQDKLVDSQIICRGIFNHSPVIEESPIGTFALRDLLLPQSSTKLVRSHEVTPRALAAEEITPRLWLPRRGKSYQNHPSQAWMLAACHAQVLSCMEQPAEQNKCCQRQWSWTL